MKIDEEMTNDQFMLEVGQRIRQERIRSRLKQAELAAQSGVSRSALVKLENGDGGVRLMTLVAVLRTLQRLHGFEVVIPPVEISPVEMMEMERHRKPMLKRVRDTKKPRKTFGAWGDGTAIRR